MTDATIVVLTHNRALALNRCLAAICSRTVTQDVEIIVVDNGSTDATLGVLDDAVKRGPFPIIPILRPTNEGVCARNHALDIADGKFILQVDDDVVVQQGWDRVLLTPMTSPEVGAVGQHGFYQDGSWTKLIDDRRRPRPGQPADLVMGYCWAWRNGLGLRYDEQFNPHWHEESDLQLQIRSAGFRIYVVPPVCIHNSLKDAAAVRSNDPIIGEQIARRNFERLRDKWRDRPLTFEGETAGLRRTS